MNLNELKYSDRIIFECVSGSRAYNLHLPEKSDFDTRGLYINPSLEYLGLSEPSGQINDEKHDIVYYSLKRIFELLQKSNPNCVELLWIPDNCVNIKTVKMDELIKYRDLFISKKCFFTHIAYARAQCEKATGQNKMINHPEMFKKPIKEDFCHVIKSPFFMGVRHIDIFSAIFPMRPMPLSKSGLDLSRFHAAGLEHVSDTYRLYDYGEQAKGVFRGDDMLVCESIPIDDEWDKFYGILIYNKNEYEKALQQHRKYKEWVDNKNPNRWIGHDNKVMKWDAKNMMHTFRLLISGEHILTHGCPLVRFEGKQRDYLMKIRNGEFQYEELMDEVEKRMENLKELYKTSTIPHSVDQGKIEALYRELTRE